MKIDLFAGWVDQKDIFVRKVANLSKRKHIDFGLRYPRPGQFCSGIEQESSDMVGIQI